MLVCRLEKLKLQTMAGKMKRVGDLLFVGRALALILYKGLSFHIGHHHHHTASRATANQSHSHWAWVPSYWSEPAYPMQHGA